MLKRTVLALALAGIVGRPVPAAATPVDFVVGSVRDGDGAPIEGADVRLGGSGGAIVGTGRTDELGTFAIAPSVPATTAEVRCAHCRAITVALGDATNLAIVVTRYRALQSDIPDARDLAALPYGRPADIFGLVPFVLTDGNGGTSVSDRGLGRRRARIDDDGAPLADLATDISALVDVPDHLANVFTLERADRAYRYGTGAGGGTFSIDTLGARSRAQVDGGSGASLAFAPVARDVHGAFGLSSDDGAIERRSDLDTLSAFAGGTLRAGFTAASGRLTGDAVDVRSSRSGARLAYATASRRYRTFASASADDAVVVGSRDYRSSYIDADFRLERPGTVDLAAGFHATRDTASYDTTNLPPYALQGTSAERTAYVEAASTIGRASLHGALALDDLTAVEALTLRDIRGERRTVLPEFDVRIALPGGVYARTGYARSIRLPTLVETDAASPPVGTALLERADLIESALGIDTGTRVRAEAIVYREETHGFDTRSLTGIGASVAWQIAPTLSVRAWSLRANAASARSFLSDLTDTTRGVLWASYVNADALRFDAIVHRDLRAPGRAIVALDGDAYVPIAAHLALEIGTARRADTRRFSFGIRAH